MTDHVPPTGDETTYRGRAGTAALVPLPKTPTAAETLSIWLIYAPGQSIAWTQYLLICVRLRDDIPGFKPPVRQFLGATHEVFVLAMDPDHPHTVDTLATRLASGRSILPHTLRPANFVEQFEATDDEMRRVVAMCAWGCVVGALPAEPALPGIRHQTQWLASMTKTLAHLRGEAHAE